jgi:1-acyl-sn-glycerol-3-phosphate acyltransferase
MPLFTHLRNFLWTAPMIALITIALGSLSLAVSLVDASGRSQHKCARVWARLLLWAAGIRVEVEGLEKIAPGGSFVFIANHRSYFDVPVILPFITAQFRFFAKKSLFHIPFLGYHLKRAGHLSVDESNPRESLKGIAEAARVIQEKGISILLFPEGTRTLGEMEAFKDGAAYIAIKAGVPIVPIGIIGATRILPMHSMTLRRGTVRMVIGDPIPTLDIPLADRTRLTAALQHRVSELIGDTAPPKAA